MRDIVSVIVLAWNGRLYLPMCLDSIQNQLSETDELLLVDNGSTDGAPLELAAERPDIRLIQNHMNLGVAAGFNKGVEAAGGKIIVLVNQDVTLMENCLQSLVKYFERNDNVGVLGCKLMYPDRQTVQHAGALIHMPSGEPIQLGRWEKDTGQYEQPRQVDYVTGAVIAFRKSIWSEVGGFDERFHPAYYEDVDFCFRASHAGYSILYIPQAMAIHHEATSVGRLSSDHYFAHHNNRLRFLWKNLSNTQIVTEFLIAELERLDWDFSENEAIALKRAYDSENRYELDEPQKIEAISMALTTLRERVARGLSIVTGREVAMRLVLH